MYWQLSLLTSCIAAISLVYMIVSGAENWGPSFAAGVLVFTVVTIFLVGPHVVFGALALSLRSHRVLSVILLFIVIAVSLSGVLAISVESNAYLNRDKSIPEGQRMGTFLIGLAQWLAAILTSAILLPVFLCLRQIPSSAKTEYPK